MLIFNRAINHCLSFFLGCIIYSRKNIFVGLNHGHSSIWNFYRITVLKV